MNVVILTGRLGQDPEFSKTHQGNSLCKFSVATTKRVKEKTLTMWHRCVAWGKTADWISKYFSKGAGIVVYGELEYGQYEKNGVKVRTCEIRVDRANFPLLQRQPQTKDSRPGTHQIESDDFQDQEDIPF